MNAEGGVCRFLFFNKGPASGNFREKMPCHVRTAIPSSPNGFLIPVALRHFHLSVAETQQINGKDLCQEKGEACLACPLSAVSFKLLFVAQKNTCRLIAITFPTYPVCLVIENWEGERMPHFLVGKFAKQGARIV